MPLNSMRAGAGRISFWRMMLDIYFRSTSGIDSKMCGPTTISWYVNDLCVWVCICVDKPFLRIKRFVWKQFSHTTAIDSWNSFGLETSQTTPHIWHTDCIKQFENTKILSQKLKKKRFQMFASDCFLFRLFIIQFSLAPYRTQLHTRFDLLMLDISSLSVLNTYWRRVGWFKIAMTWSNSAVDVSSNWGVVAGGL